VAEKTTPRGRPKGPAGTPRLYEVIYPVRVVVLATSEKKAVKAGWEAIKKDIQDIDEIPVIPPKGTMSMVLLEKTERRFDNLWKRTSLPVVNEDVRLSLASRTIGDLIKLEQKAASQLRARAPVA
jgi:hypothetical protein